MPFLLFVRIALSYGSIKKMRPGKYPGSLRVYLNKWCRRRESNSYGFPHTPLKRACLPIPPPRRTLGHYTQDSTCCQPKNSKSGLGRLKGCCCYCGKRAASALFRQPQRASKNCGILPSSENYVVFSARSSQIARYTSHR